MPTAEQLNQQFRQTSGQTPPQSPALRLNQQLQNNPELNPPERRTGLIGQITGEARREFDYPEVPGALAVQSPGGGTGEGEIGAKLSLGRDDLRKLDIARSIFGNVPAEYDEFGNVYIELDEETLAPYQLEGFDPIEPGRYYLNRPGISRQDMADLGTAATIEGVGAAVLGRLGRVAGGLGRVIGVGAGTGGGSVAQDLLAEREGSQRGVDTQAALVSAGLGVGGELAAPVVRFLGRAFGPGSRYVRSNGEITRAGRAALRNAGIDPDRVTPEFLRDFRSLASRTDDPAAAAAVAQAQGLPQPVRLSPADATRNMATRAREDALLTRPAGDPAGDAMRAFREGQEGALRANLPAIQEQIAGGSSRVAAPGEGMRMVQQEMLDRYRQAQQRVRGLYQTAREGSDAIIDPAAADDFAASALEPIKREFRGTIDTNAPVFQLIDEFDGFVRGPAAEFNQETGEWTGDVTIRGMEEWLQKVNRRLRNTTDPAERAALREVRGSYEEWADDAIDRAILDGNEDALRLWQEARAGRRDVAQRFESDAILGRLIETVPESGETALRATPQEALNYIFTASGRGAKQGAGRTLRVLRNELGEDSDAWQALREEAFLRLLNNQNINNLNQGAEMATNFSGDRFATAFSSMQRNNPEIINNLFTQDEISLMTDLQDVARRIQNTPRVRSNPSGTAAFAPAVAGAWMRMFGDNPVSLGGMAVARRLLGFLGENASGPATAARLAQPLPPRATPPGLFGAGAAVGGGAALEDQRYQSNSQ